MEICRPEFCKIPVGVAAGQSSGGNIFSSPTRYNLLIRVAHLPMIISTVEFEILKSGGKDLQQDVLFLMIANCRALLGLVFRASHGFVPVMNGTSIIYK